MLWTYTYSHYGVEYSIVTMSAPEINKGDFLYRDTLFVNLGPSKCHPRASVSELKALLLPKKGSAPKDQVAHWYEAQLIHYGLPRSKDKNTAKVRLTSAISAGLVLPVDIMRTEADMKKQYASAVRKANAGTGTHSEAVSKGKKREADGLGAGNGSSTTLSFNFADGTSMNVNHQAGVAAGAGSKKRKADSAPAKKETQKPKVRAAPKTNSKETPRPRPKAPAGKIANNPASDRNTSSTVSQRPIAVSAPRTKQTARRSQPHQYGTSTRSPPTSSQPTYDHTPSSFQDLESDEEDAPPAYESLDFDDQYSPAQSNIVQISGSYYIEDPTLTISTLALRLDTSTNELWGQFTIGSKRGILRCDADGLADSENKTFAWRSEDMETGGFDFRRGCEGEIEFDGNGRVKGRFYALVYREVVEFDADLESKHDAPDADYLRDQWERIPRLAYGRS